MEWEAAGPPCPNVSSAGLGMGLDQESLQRYQVVVDMLMNARAFQGDAAEPLPTSCLELRHEDAMDELAILEAFCEKGWVAAMRRHAASSSWYLTREGLESFGLAQPLHKPRPVLEPRAGVALAKLTNFEMLVKLIDAGWEMQLAPRGRRALRMKLAAKPAKLCDGDHIEPK
eukprot:10520839-Alexandrium_andersonii.AAC.1